MSQETKVISEEKSSKNQTSLHSKDLKEARPEEVVAVLLSDLLKLDKNKPVKIIAGLPRSGKTALMVSLLSAKMFGAGGMELLEKSYSLVANINRKANSHFTPPPRPPVYTNFDINVLSDYETYTKSFFLTGWRFALPTAPFPVINVAPGSAIGFQEAQIYYDSHDFQSFPRAASEKFETAGHAGYDIYLDTQNPALINKNIRKLCGRYIWIDELRHDKDDEGNITHSHWSLTVYSSFEDFEAKVNGIRATHTHEGDVFELYESENYLLKHSPLVKTTKTIFDAKSLPKDFHYFEHPSGNELEVSEIFSHAPPREWRAAA